jgi:predicted nucleic acid-binding protein
VIFVDSNVPMYLVGAAHTNKATAQILGESLIARGERLVTDAQVLQEILHRYTAINRRDASDPAIQLNLSVVDEVFAVEKPDVLRAREIAQSRTALTARDALHIAIMERQRIRSILSFDSDFDHWPGLRRYHEI